MKLLISLFFLTNFLFSDSIDVIYLKDGSVIKGEIIENVINDYIKIESGQNIYVYKIELIDKILIEEKEPIYKKNHSFGFLYLGTNGESKDYYFLRYKLRFNDKLFTECNYKYQYVDNSLPGYSTTISALLGYNIATLDNVSIELLAGYHKSHRTYYQTHNIENHSAKFGAEFDVFYNRNFGFSFIIAVEQEFWFNGFGVIVDTEYEIRPNLSINYNF